MKVLVVEDHPDIAQSLVNALTDLRLAAEVAATGNDADERLRTEKYGLVVLDLSLPGLDGIELLRRLRAFDRHTPVLVLTARGSIDDRVRGLQSGADDYLTKPFDLREFEARVSALLRRVGGGSLQAGRLQFDSTNRAFAIDGVPLELTPRESAVLEALIARLGRVVAKEVLFDK
ncbi:MAG TPA: response regulator, partial [Burkholderiaceae bacterium]|nr:response regulator [Burkholderiaceae bacterium]